MPISDPAPPGFEALAARARTLAAPGERAILGIAGSPGSGKSTLAERLVAELSRNAPVAAYLPMDGFHLADVTLDRLALRNRKGAIDTFDGWGYLALLGRLRTEREHTVYAPNFERSRGEPVAGAIAVPPSTSLIVTEGNYLLVDRPPWNRVADLLTESWFCVTAADTRRERLVRRHIQHGRTTAEASAWVDTVDSDNAELIEPSRIRADLLVSGSR